MGQILIVQIYLSTMELAKVIVVVRIKMIAYVAKQVKFSAQAHKIVKTIKIVLEIA